MRYFKWLNDYNDKALSAAEVQAFEHELAENAKLQAEKEAVDLAEALLSAVGNSPLSGIPADAPSGISVAARWKIPAFLLAGLLVVVLGIWFYSTPPAAEASQPVIPTEQELSAPPTPPAKESNKPDTPRPVAAIAEPATSAPQTSSQPVEAIAKATTKEKTTTPAVAPNEGRAPQPITIPEETQTAASTTPINRSAIYTVKAVLDTVLSETTATALTATQQILLKPGFHAKAGTSFKARVDDGPLFRRSSDEK